MTGTHPFGRLALLSLLGSALLLGGCGKEEAPAPVIPTVGVVKAELQQIKPSADFVGRTQANEDVSVRSRVSGHLLERFFQEGQTVTKGDLLYRIDPEPYQEVVTQRNAELARYQANKEVAELNYNRGKRLIGKGVISQSQMDELTARKLESDANVKAAEANLASAELNLSYTNIYAPVDGQIGRTEKSIGDLISANTDTLVNLVNIDPIHVYFQIDEKTLLNVQQRQQQQGTVGEGIDAVAKLRLSNNSLYNQTGALDFMNNRIDPQTGTVELRAVFPNNEQLLRPGQFVTVIIEAREAEEMLTVPQVAIQEDQRGRFVLVVNADSEVEPRVVKTGRRLGIHWVITEGLKDGETVIVEGIQKVRPGAKVNTTPHEMPFQSQAEPAAGAPMAEHNPLFSEHQA